MEADASSPLPSLPPSGHGLLPHSKEGPPRFLFILTELACSSKGAIQQVTGLDLFARSTEQPWCNPCSPPATPAAARLQTAGGHRRCGFEKEPRPILPLCLFIHRSNEYRTFCRCMCETDSLASIFFSPVPLYVRLTTAIIRKWQRMNKVRRKSKSSPSGSSTYVTKCAYEP